MTINKPKKQHNASVTVTCILWLQQYKDSFKDYTWKQALHRFNSEHSIQMSPKTFQESATKLNIEFRQPKPPRANSTPQPSGSGVVIAKLLRLLVKDIETAVGGPVASPKVKNILTAMIGKRTLAELEQLVEDNNDN